ncbi:hypothetical protein PV325_001345 [Microctonus aethiopoides]|uniref:La protein homolog n=1 Tax=Microctonus aethiopoides TaxID=144406 RepID=A0AA39KJJ7_9HYME|nr:hypothetical protein PV325_001345 [Microctonus aethiopoides]KAK0082137.1 hypothetical protein PV326_007327 [Microctonus aethiopoides]KAK0163809.1 hypothetical protein PV328_002502 [Microctonus aethiopoides]
MENGKQETKVEANDKPVADAVDEKKIDNVETTKENDKETKSEENKVEEPSPELMEKIQQQIEFYFGDINMQRDKFLIEQTKLDDGWVPMAVMLNFKMLASLSKDIPTILKSIETSDLIEISEDRKKIRRRPDKPLPIYDEEYRKSQTARTVYVKGFPLKDFGMQELKDFFKDFEPVENIVMKKYKDSDKQMQFKGSIFVQFKTLDDAKAFLARESVKYNEVELIKMFSEEYALSKAKEREESKRKNESKGKKNNKKAEEDEETEKPSSDDVDLPKGSVLRFTGASEETYWEDLKTSLVDLGAEVAYVDYKPGQTEGWIRLQGTNAAQSILDKMTDKKIKIDDTEVAFEILEGDEETTYLKKVKRDMASRKQKATKSKRGRGKRGRGGFQHGKKRVGSPLRDSSPAKKATN